MLLLRPLTLDFPVSDSALVFLLKTVSFRLVKRRRVCAPHLNCFDRILGKVDIIAPQPKIHAVTIEMLPLKPLTLEFTVSDSAFVFLLEN